MHTIHGRWNDAPDAVTLIDAHHHLWDLSQRKHPGFPWDRSEEGLAAWRRAMEALAREPNVHVKVSEFGLKDHPWDYQSNRRVVLDALATFGIERAIFASNFSVAGLRIGYDALIAAMSRMLRHLSPADRDRFFWKNAKAFYRL